ncbi:hypothetical protein NVS89_22395 [Ancylobacter sp. MQZ15Z-1]|uniref:Uncharacterized protein n=1 Tax=Ancylobacter mangrovi TaxID=2972472 RepID=A0A9X2PH75_9HYPH|nr:hypothetical protein [Ancylobacter mangrovi]MCS0497845.1 hypothetical protein [Ancylobacter mangrovi]
MGALLDLFPAWLNGLSAWAFLVLGGAALVYGLFPLAPYRALVQIGGAAAIGYACYLAGYSGAQAACEAGRLAAENAALKRDATIAEEVQQRSEASLAKSQMDLASLQEERDALATKYASAVRRAGDCVLGDDLRRSLRRPE